MLKWIMGKQISYHNIFYISCTPIILILSCRRTVTVMCVHVGGTVMVMCVHVCVCIHCMCMCVCVCVCVWCYHALVWLHDNNYKCWCAIICECIK